MSYRIHCLSSLFFLLISSIAYGAESVVDETVIEAQWWDGMSVYAGAGVGQSYVDSKLNLDEYTLGNQIQNAWKLSAGLDFNEYISIEGFYAVLGSEELSPGAEMGYRMLGASAMLHYWAYGSERAPGSIALYAKAGLTHQTNKTNDVRYQSENKVPLLGGVGAEVYLPEMFSIRLELESYDTDAAMVSLNVLKRFGFKVRAPIVMPKKPVIKMVVLTPVVFDADLDGILDDEDQCLGSSEGALVDEFGCIAH
jgi:hypothetical protein